MVYVYVCKRFRILMDMTGDRDIDWINAVLNTYATHMRIHTKLERAEINVKRWSGVVVPYETATDKFRLTIVYKDARDDEHELHWLISVTRSDINVVAERLLRHERQIYARLQSDLTNIIRQRASGRLEGARLSMSDLLVMPQHIYDETSTTMTQVKFANCPPKRPPPHSQSADSCNASFGNLRSLARGKSVPCSSNSSSTSFSNSSSPTLALPAMPVNSAAQAGCRTALVLDGLEAKGFSVAEAERGGGARSSVKAKSTSISAVPPAFDLIHFKAAVECLAKFHAVGLVYKQAMFNSFSTHAAQVKATRSQDEVIMEGEGEVATGRKGLFARFPFLAQRQELISHLVEKAKCESLFAAHRELLANSKSDDATDRCELLDTLDKIRVAAQRLISLDPAEPVSEEASVAVTTGGLESPSLTSPPPSPLYSQTTFGAGSPRRPNLGFGGRQNSTASTISSSTNASTADEDDDSHPLDSICVGILEANSFMFHYPSARGDGCRGTEGGSGDEKYDDFNKENKAFVRTNTQNSFFNKTTCNLPARTGMRGRLSKTRLQRSQSDRIPSRPSMPVVPRIVESKMVVEPANMVPSRPTHLPFAVPLAEKVVMVEKKIDKSPCAMDDKSPDSPLHTDPDDERVATQVATNATEHQQMDVSEPSPKLPKSSSPPAIFTFDVSQPTMSAMSASLPSPLSGQIKSLNKPPRMTSLLTQSSNNIETVQIKDSRPVEATLNMLPPIASPTATPSSFTSQQAQLRDGPKNHTQEVKSASQTGEQVKLTRSGGQSALPCASDSLTKPDRVALVNAKYISYGRILRDLSVLFWTAGSSLIRRYYLIKFFNVYVETLGITLGRLGFDTDAIGLKYLDMLREFQAAIPYGYVIGLLLNMTTSAPTADKDKPVVGAEECLAEPQSASALVRHRLSGPKEDGVIVQSDPDSHEFNHPLTDDRLEYILDLTRDIHAYLQSQDFYSMLPLTNFYRYHELLAAHKRRKKMYTKSHRMTPDNCQLLARRPESDAPGTEDDDTEDEDEYYYSESDISEASVATTTIAAQ